MQRQRLCWASWAAAAAWVLSSAATRGDDNYYHASTPAESYSRGMSDLVRAAGETNLRNSEAAINYEEARSRNMDNRLKYTQTYFENRRINREAVAAERGPHTTTEQAFRMARSGMPSRLSPTEIDPLSGEIYWPAVLQFEKYDPQRTSVEPMFRKRAYSKAKLPGPDYLEAKKVVAAWTELLKKDIKEYPPQEYTTARTFLTNLGYEASFPPR